MLLRVMDLCKQVPRMNVQIIGASTGEVLFEGKLNDCPYRICDMDIEKMEACFLNGTDYIISVD